MTGQASRFTGSIPGHYDRGLGPHLFIDYATDLAQRTAACKPSRVLELAAGTGIVTRQLRDALPSAAELIASDLNPPMLDVARGKFAGGEKIEFRRVDATALPFQDEAFDAVACQFGVMFFPDKIKGYAEAHRVLKPGGTYIVAVWDKVASNEFISVATEELARCFPDDPPRFMERSPHGYHDPAQLAADAKAGGFATVTVETVDKISRTPSALSAATGYCQGNPLRGEIEARAPGELQAVTEQVAAALAKRFGEGPIEGRIRAIIVTATR
jgi:SAM-dependent methyltransferase